MNRSYDRYPLHSRLYAASVGILASLRQRTRARHTQNPCILRMEERGWGGESASETDRCDRRAASGARGERRRRVASSLRVISRLTAVADGRRNESSPAARLRAATLNAGRGEGVTRGTPCLSARLDAAADDTGRRVFRRRQLGGKTRSPAKCWRARPTRPNLRVRPGSIPWHIGPTERVSPEYRGVLFLCETFCSRESRVNLVDGLVLYMSATDRDLALHPVDDYLSRGFHCTDHRPATLSSSYWWVNWRIVYFQVKSVSRLQEIDLSQIIGRW